LIPVPPISMPIAVVVGVAAAEVGTDVGREPVDPVVALITTNLPP